MLSDKSLWILEDDPGCQFVYKQILSIRYKTRFFSSLGEFKEAFANLAPAEAPHLVIADLWLEDGSFLSFLGTEHSRDFKKSSLFMVISSLDDIDALRYCFQEGARDYLIKPFKAAELIVKIERLATSSSGQKLDATKKITDLTMKEQQILALFQNSKDNVISRSEIFSAVWSGLKVDPKTLDVHLYNLRRKLEDVGLEIRSVGPGRWALLRDEMQRKPFQERCPTER